MPANGRWDLTRRLKGQIPGDFSRLLHVMSHRLLLHKSHPSHVELNLNFSKDTFKVSYVSVGDKWPALGNAVMNLRVP
jgi:hypothetical protein